MHLRPEPLNEGAGVGFLENHHLIHAAQGQEHLPPRFLGVDGAIWTFECAHAGIAVEAHDEAIAQRAGFGEVPHVADMKNVETPVGEDGLHFAPPRSRS